MLTVNLYNWLCDRLLLLLLLIIIIIFLPDLQLILGQTHDETENGNWQPTFAEVSDHVL